jgi:serine/threonine-protein kinase
LAAKLWHPHIVGVHDRGEYDGQLWIAMDFVDGTDAARLLADRYPAGMPTGEVAAIVMSVAGALDYAHKRSLLHRDVKPANIMLADLDDESERRILLTDFGIARNVDDISGLTTTNMTVGTVAYCAPEQLMGEELDGRADQYALAATAYHLLTGAQLFPHSNPAVVISRHLNTPAPTLADTRAELAALDPILATALAKHPDERYPRCLDFARALAESAAPQGKPAPAATTISRLAAPSATVTNQPPARAPAVKVQRGRASRRWLILAAGTALLLVMGAIAFAWQPWQQPRSTNTATSTSPPGTTAVSTALPPATSLAPPPPPPAATTLTPPPPATTAATPNGPTLGEPCNDWDKLDYDRNAGENLGLIVCGSNTSGPTAKLLWVEAPLVNSTHVAGSPCPGVEQATVFSRSTDGYLLFCLASDNGRAYLPGGQTVTVGAAPVWQLYSP